MAVRTSFRLGDNVHLTFSQGFETQHSFEAVYAGENATEVTFDVLTTGGPAIPLTVSKKGKNRFEKDGWDVSVVKAQ